MVLLKLKDPPGLQLQLLLSFFFSLNLPVVPETHPMVSGSSLELAPILKNVSGKSIHCFLGLGKVSRCFI